MMIGILGIQCGCRLKGRQSLLMIAGGSRCLCQTNLGLGVIGSQVGSATKGHHPVLGLAHFDERIPRLPE